jgi:multidrug efflux pump subunit AcrA (membrane-fusion protein)
MRRYRFLSAVLVAATLMTAQLPAVFAQTTDSAASTTTAAKRKHRAREHREHRETAEERQMRELKESLKAQQDQIDALKAQISSKSGDTAAAQQTAADAQAAAAAAAASAQQAQAAAAANASKVDAVSSSVTELKSTTAEQQAQVAASQQKMRAEIESPSALRYKGVTITPGGFAAFEGVYRQHSVNSDINTPLNSIPLPSANEGHVSELNFSGRQSRLSVLVAGDAGSYKLSGYYEMDFLGTGTSSNNNQSNSYVLRQRQIWGKAEMQSGFTVTGGQMWSLVTEDAKGTDARTEVLPQTIDPQYMAGYTWTRQPGIRVQQRFGNFNTHAFTIAASAEQAQITGFTASGQIPVDFYFGGIGQNGGLYNAAGNIGAGNTAGTGGITTYANNVAPDVIVKAAFDMPKMHVEVGGIGRFLRDEFFPVLTTALSTTAGVTTETYTYGTTLDSHTSDAGGVFGSIRVHPSKMFEVGLQAMGGQGVGRYGSSQLADATLRPNETLEPIRNYHGLFSFVAHPMKKLDMYTYYGGEYAQRTVYTTGEGDLIGYGPRNLSDTGCYNLPSPSGNSSGSAGSISASGCSSPTRYIQEAMGGLTYRAIDSPTYGRLQYQVTYSYVQRNLWSGVGAGRDPSGPRATEPMIHVSMRYYIP